MVDRDPYKEEDTRFSHTLPEEERVSLLLNDIAPNKGHHGCLPWDSLECYH